MTVLDLTELDLSKDELRELSKVGALFTALNYLGTNGLQKKFMRGLFKGR